jgi:hypothetical protein
MSALEVCPIPDELTTSGAVQNNVPKNVAFSASGEVLFVGVDRPKSEILQVPE